ncbi:putative Sensor with Chase2 domain protein [Nostoc sp. NIES-3756]|uniref:sensor histidine kinase n=1 Tax=Nostoc sp. NIES-3756 TaxID=1751286 RepID=UPI0007214AC1|nr:CHASE2 domain-containing protein [Nostoc sp. NIES-3756]BAT54351.1 putative Sensor with Chase2 domain protein [Nostoc sp. NIES-3756]
MWFTWRQVKQEIFIWRQAALPGITVLGLIIVARFAGLLQGIELMALDTLLRLRPSEQTDDKVVIIGIDEEDINNIGTYPIPDQEIASLIQKIQTYKPTVIGLDIVRNIPVEPGHQELRRVFQQYQNIVAIEKILPPGEFLPPPILPAQQAGFSDVIADEDGNYRRYLLWTSNPKNEDEDKYSLALRLATVYLSAQNIDIETGIHDLNTIRFNKAELPRILPNSGGYIVRDKTKIEDGGLKILVNFRSGEKPFPTISLNKIKKGDFPPQLLANKIVIIGITASSAADFFNTSAINHAKISRQIYGVEFHAHVTSQIINTVLNSRPMLKVWSKEWEYLWIILWGFLPIIVGRVTQDIWKNLLAVILAGFALSYIAYLLILSGWWIPAAPSLLILGINGLGLSAFAFYKYDQEQKSKINERQQTIEHTFTLIHNGPLQSLANILSQARTENLSNEQLVLNLESLNYEIRAIGEYLRIEALSPDESLRLGSGLKIDLKRPIHELFYEVYTSTIERQDLEYFQNINVKVRTFDPIDDRYLSLRSKQELCLFLEEALCNVGKHAQGSKRVESIGKQEHNFYKLTIKDNGCGLNSSSESKGTKQLKNIASNLGGEFTRESAYPKGTVCEITWKLKSNRSNY